MINKFRFRQYAKASGLKYKKRQDLHHELDCDYYVTNGQKRIYMLRKWNRKEGHVEHFKLQCYGLKRYG